nr:reverse transcriptase domain-containing protein [Tanacetum cinerariifolium]
MANTTPIVTTITKTVTKEKTPNEAESTSRVNILDFCEEHYEDILPVMDKFCCDNRKEVHTSLDFREKSLRMRGDSQNSSTKTLSTRYRNSSEKPQIQDNLRNNDKNVFGWLVIILGVETAPTAWKNRMVIPTLLTEQWTNIGITLMAQGAPVAIKKEGIVNPYYLARQRVQKKYVKVPVEIHKIIQKDKETIEDFLERYKVKTGRIKGTPECMGIFRFMHEVNNPELTKRLNKHVSKIVEEMMTTTKAFILGETTAASKKKPKDGKGSNKFTHLTRTPKEIFVAKSGKFKPPSPMLISIEKRSSNKFYEFHKDEGHSIDECCQDTRRSTSGSMQMPGDRLVSWSSKREKCPAISSTKAEYIALSVCCAQVLWMRSQL